tara:strand:- start:772 stop:1530 length:759 start_codon:yes stop_codon:yes gene_type:complete
MVSKTVIISSFEPQYLHFFNEYKIYKYKDIEYFFIKNKNIGVIQNFWQNFKKSFKNKKTKKLLIYYFQSFIFFKKYSKYYKKSIKDCLNKKYNKKINTNEFNIINNIDEINLDKNITYDLILFGSEYVPRSFYLKFKNTFNIHFGLLPDFKGLRAFERMYLNDLVPYISVNELASSIDSGRILYSESIKNKKSHNYYKKLILSHELAYEIVYKIINKKLKLLSNSNSYSDLFFGFEFNELMYKKLLQKIHNA